MKKLLIVAFVFSALFSKPALAHEYYEYDYETGEERIIEIPDVALTLNESSTTSNIISKPSLKELSAYSIITGSQLGRVTSLSIPYRYIMCLSLRRDLDGNGSIDSTAVATGFLVGPDLMLTAGHCMYGSEGGNVDEMRVYYLQNSTSLQSYCYPASWITPVEFKNGDFNYDWCLVKLQKPLGTSYGYFKTSIPTENVDLVRVSGYPDSSSMYYFQYTSTGIMEIASSYRIRYKCSTLPGHSGSPVFDTNTNVVYGIHSTGPDGWNYGVKISQRIINLINNWR